MSEPSQNDILECVCKAEPRWNDVECHQYDRILVLFSVISSLILFALMMCLLLAGGDSCPAL